MSVKANGLKMKIAVAFVLLFITFMCFMIYLVGMHGHLMFRQHMTEECRAEKTLMNERNNNELLIKNLATVPADRNSNSMPA